MAGSDLPKALVTGIRLARCVAGVELPDPPIWMAESEQWVLKALVHSRSQTSTNDPGFVSERSIWYVVIDSSYPFGSIEVFPASASGITVTFPHQQMNLQGKESGLYRSGKLCLDTPALQIADLLASNDPVGEPELRLRWYLERASAWVRAAATQTLVRPGDPFEVPEHPFTSRIRLIHDESMECFANWERLAQGSWGLVTFSQWQGRSDAFVAQGFFQSDFQLVRQTRRFDSILHNPRKRDKSTGFWWLWPRPLVVPPWQAPRTWGELWQIGKSQHIDVDLTLSQFARLSRETDARYLLLGYPIPDRISEPSAEVYWQGVQLPKFIRYTHAPKGFRRMESGYWVRDRRVHFNPKNEIEYMKTENHHPDRLLARGRLSQGLQDCRIALIGCGALGAAVAEIIVRGGVQQVTLIDHDTLGAENLVRHPLSGLDVGKNKATALKDRLNSLSLDASVLAYPHELPTKESDLVSLLEPFDIIVDCTASQSVNLTLGLSWWSRPRLFCSLSVGYKARRLFIMAQQGNSWPGQVLLQSLQPLLDEERIEWAENGEVLQGAGCWSPIFPARYDDILIAAANAIKLLEELVQNQSPQAKIIVIEQQFSNGCFVGTRRTELPIPEEVDAF